MLWCAVACHCMSKEAHSCCWLLEAQALEPCRPAQEHGKRSLLAGTSTRCTGDNCISQRCLLWDVGVQGVWPTLRAAAPRVMHTAWGCNQCDKVKRHKTNPGAGSPAACGAQHLPHGQWCKVSDGSGFGSLLVYSQNWIRVCVFTPAASCGGVCKLSKSRMAQQCCGGNALPGTSAEDGVAVCSVTMPDWLS